MKRQHPGVIRTIRLLAILAVMALMTAACGDSDPDDGQAGADPDDGAATEPDEPADPDDEEEEDDGGEPAEAPPADLDEVTLVAAGYAAPTHIMHISVEEFAERLTEASGGQITVEYHPAGALVAQTDMLPAGSAGTVDIVAITSSVFPGELPFSASAATLPFLWNLDTYPEARDVYLPYLTDELEAQGLRPLWLLPTITQWFFNDPVELDDPDLSGRSIRSFGGYSVETIELLGGTAVTIGNDELPTAVATGIIDGLGTSVSSFIGLGLHEDVDCALLSNDVPLIAHLAINTDTWDSLQPEAQAVIEEVAAEIADFSYEWSVDNEEDVQSQLRESLDCVLEFENDEQVATWQDRLQPIYDEFSEQFGEQGEEFLSAVRGD